MKHINKFSAFDFLGESWKPDPDKIYYHFSDGDFDRFVGQDDPAYARKHSATNRGIYFHDAPPLARYGKNMYEVRLRMKNPLVIDNRTYVSDVVNPYTGKNIEVEHIRPDDIRYLKELGHDAVVARYPAFQTVVFDPDQITIVRKNGIAAGTSTK